MKEAAKPVVVEAAEPVAGSLDLLDDEVQVFGGSGGGAGGVLVEDLGPPSGEGTVEGLDQGHNTGSLNVEVELGP